MKQVVIYSVKVWLTTAIVAPVLISLLGYFLFRNYLMSIHAGPRHTDMLLHRQLRRACEMVVLDLVDLIPLCLGLYYTIRFLVKRKVLLNYYKRYLTLVGVPFAVLPQVLLSGYMIWITNDSYYQKLNLRAMAVDSLFFAMVVVPSIWLYKLKHVQITPNSPSNL